CHFIHDDKRGFIQYLKRIVDLCAAEAKAKENNLLGGKKVSLLSKSATERRRAKKIIFSKMPFKSLIMFFYLYVWKLGFLEGRVGFYHCVYRAMCEISVDILRYEKDQQIK
ncbi:hypothetical protein, partial [Shewanella sp.]|uniref:hypothetical protein n=1 Tax=Shewanella sp. TaxID=50422 RepID=UPI0040481C60